MILINALTRDKKRKKRYQVEETEPQLISIVDTEQFFFFEKISKFISLTVCESVIP